eukprot:4236154-Lingulodinium_polyedra.AAC.1
MRTACACVSQAKNTLRRRCGYSPAQWVFGADPRLPGCIVDEPGQLAVHDQALDPASEVARRLAIRAAARRGFCEMQNDDALRRAMLGRARVKVINPAVGDAVYYWRPDHAKGGSWRGPAAVIGLEGSNVWVTHGGRPYLCSPEHVRAATVEEAWDYGDDNPELAKDMEKARHEVPSEMAEFEDVRAQPTARKRKG